MKKNFYAAASLLFLLTDVSYSQVTRGGEVNFDMDMATFRASEGWTYLEIYYAVQRDSISHIFTKGRFEGNLELGAQFFLGDSVAARQNFQSVDIVDSLAEIRPGQHLYNQISFYLKDGDYTLHTYINDQKRNAGGWYRQPVRISAYGRDSLNVSDIQLSTSMSADTSKDRFNKNGYRILPNASGMYGLELPVLFYYCEIYNLSGLDRSLDSNYTVHVSIQDMNQRVVKEMPAKTKKRMAGSLVEVGRLNVAGLVSGPYRLQVNVRDGGTEKEVTRLKNFYVYRPGDFVRAPVVETAGGNFMDEFAGMTEDELDEHFEKCKYIRTRQDDRTYKKLDLMGKRNFMKAFWRSLDTDPLTPHNEYKTEYLERVVYTESHFGTKNTPGWKTDLGRVLIKYGHPDEIERFPNSMDRREYQIWHYFGIEGGVDFIFVDIRNFGSLRLVHSTARDELQDYEWECWLY